MSLYLDKKYASQVSNRLDKFSWTRQFLAVCRCPFCGDSKAKQNRRRFYIYQNTRNGFVNHLSVMCHNCGYSNPFGAFLKEFSIGDYKAYNVERFQEDSSYQRKVVETEEEVSYKPSDKLIRMFKDFVPRNCVKICALPEDHIAVMQMKKRKLPEWFYNTLWYTNSFNSLILELRQDLKPDDIKGFDEPRIVIPFYNQEGSFYMFQGRSLNNTSIRYLTQKLDDDSDKIFGLDRADLSKTVYVVEGPIDSSFIPNCIATADASLDYASKYTKDLVLIPDNQYRNKDLCRQIQGFIDGGYRVVLFPNTDAGKDINNMIESGMTEEEVFKLIQQNTFKGLSAQLVFNKLKK